MLRKRLLWVAILGAGFAMVASAFASARSTASATCTDEIGSLRGGACGLKCSTWSICNSSATKCYMYTAQQCPGKWEDVNQGGLTGWFCPTGIYSHCDLSQYQLCRIDYDCKVVYGGCERTYNYDPINTFSAYTHCVNY
jgi:hypothetical protein